MSDQRKFVELLGEITNIAITNDNSISTDEIDEYFGDMELSDEQLEYVYDYMCKGGITVKGYINGVSNNTDNASHSKDNQKQTDSGELSSVRLKNYRKSVRELPIAKDDKLEEACICLLNGNAGDIHKNIVIESHLSTVMNIAAKYTGRGVSSDELIEEGNLALVVAINDIVTGTIVEMDPKKNARDICEEYIRNRVRAAIIKCIDSVNEHETALYATVAKAGLVNEAVKTLAQEYGRIATLNELSQYTHIPVKEIEDIVKLSAGSIEIGKE